MNPAINKQKLLDCIIRFQQQHGRTPGMKELRMLTGVRSIEHYLNCLVREGAIKRVKWSRHIQVLGDTVKTVDRRTIRRSTKPQPVKLDGRRINNQRLATKRTQEKSHGRGADFVIHGKISSRRDPGLQKRIDDVVKAALERENDHNTDVVNDYRNSRFRVNGLKCTRVG